MSEPQDDFDVETTSAEPTSPPAPVAEAPAPVATPPATPEPVESDEEEMETPPAVAAEPAQPRTPQGQFDKKPKKGSLQWRINQAHWEREEARREAARERQEREVLAKRLDEIERSQRGQAAPVSEGRPQLEHYQSYEDYVEAVADWKAEAKARAVAEAFEQRESARERQERGRTLHQRITNFVQEYPDYPSVIESAKDLALSPVMMQVIAESEQGPAIAYYLGTHPEEGHQLAMDSMSVPLEAAPVMRRLLESKLAAVTASPAQSASVVRSTVPTPIKPVGSAPVAVSDGPPDPNDEDNLDAHVVYYNKLEKRQARAR